MMESWNPTGNATTRTSGRLPNLTAGIPSSLASLVAVWAEKRGAFRPSYFPSDSDSGRLRIPIAITTNLRYPLNAFQLTNEGWLSLARSLSNQEPFIFYSGAVSCFQLKEETVTFITSEDAEINQEIQLNSASPRLPDANEQEV